MARIFYDTLLYGLISATSISITPDNAKFIMAKFSNNAITMIEIMK